MTNWASSVIETHPAAANLPVAERSRFGLHLRRSGRRRLALLSGAPVHYYHSPSRSWQEIDTRLQARGDGSLGAPGLPFRLELDGSVKVEGTAQAAALHRHKAWRVGLFAAGRFHELARLGPGQVHADQLRRQAGPFHHQITLLPGGLREELLLAELPPAPAERDALLVVESLLPAGGFPAGWLGEAQRGALRFPMGWAQDAAGQRLPLARWVQVDKQGQRLYSGVPYDWLQQAKFPVVLDPDIDISGHVGDGTIWGANPSTSSGQTNTATQLTVGGRLASGEPYVWRSYLKFDTSSLGLAAVVEKANLTLYVVTLQSYVAWTIHLRQYNWSAHDAFSAGTREAAWDGLLAASNTAVMGTSSNPVGTYLTTADLPTAWINILGNTYYGLRCNQEGYGYPNNQGGMHEYASANHGNPLYRPVLALEYLAGYPRSGPLPLRARLLPPRPRLADTRQRLSARARRTALTARIARN
ncbi:MAG: DNRLRE domain-containing protein [Anaerolineales bacterium]|nr:DNRLRE domain-containing protein [Anaerolineales bacterium]MCW5856034.1 DNRLRE domain-containing protein [Anaerolineales bacterium]